MQKKKKLTNFQRIIELFAQKIGKIGTKLSKIWAWDPGSGKNLFRIPDPEVKKAPDPDPQHCQNKYGTRGSGKRLGCIDVSTGVVTTGPAANQVV